MAEIAISLNTSQVAFCKWLSRYCKQKGSNAYGENGYEFYFMYSISPERASHSIAAIPVTELKLIDAEKEEYAFEWPDWIQDAIKISWLELEPGKRTEVTISHSMGRRTLQPWLDILKEIGKAWPEPLTREVNEPAEPEGEARKNVFAWLDYRDNYKKITGKKMTYEMLSKKCDYYFQPGTFEQAARPWKLERGITK